MNKRRWKKYNEKKKKERQEELKNHPDAIECKICGNKYIQVGTHIVQAHGMTAREYREEYGLDVKRGLTKGSYRKLKAKQVRENGTIENLKKGAKYRLKKGESIDYKRSKQTLKRLKNLHKTKEK